MQLFCQDFIGMIEEYIDKGKSNLVSIKKEFNPVNL